MHIWWWRKYTVRFDSYQELFSFFPFSVLVCQNWSIPCWQCWHVPCPPIKINNKPFWPRTPPAPAHLTAPLSLSCHGLHGPSVHYHLCSAAVSSGGWSRWSRWSVCSVQRRDDHWLVLAVNTGQHQQLAWPAHSTGSPALGWPAAASVDSTPA